MPATIDGAKVVAMLRAAIEGIKARGQSDVGDKTLIDALVPLTDRSSRSCAAGADAGAALAAAAAAAREAAEATSPMIAKRGRASYTGERSIGSVDAGAMAVAVIVEQISRSWPSVAQGGPRMKKFVNDPKQFVPEMLEGIALANPDTITLRPRVQPDHALGRARATTRSRSSRARARATSRRTS